MKYFAADFRASLRSGYARPACHAEIGSLQPAEDPLTKTRFLSKQTRPPLKVRVALITAITIVGGIFSTMGFFLTWWAWAYPLNYWDIMHPIFHFLFGWM